MKKAFKQDGFCWGMMTAVYAHQHTQVHGKKKKSTEQMTTEGNAAANTISYPKQRNSSGHKNYPPATKKNKFVKPH